MKGIVVFVIVTLVVMVHSIPYSSRVSNDVTIGIYGSSDTSNFCLNPDCGDEDNQVVNLFINASCGDSAAEQFVEGNTSTINFNITEFVMTILSNTCGFQNLIENSQQLFSQLPQLSTKLQINIIEGTQVLPVCNETCEGNNTLTVNVYVPKLCDMSHCFCQASSEYIQDIIGPKRNGITHFTISICVNSANLIAQGLVAPYYGWKLQGFFRDFKRTERSTLTVNGVGSVSPDGTASGTFSYSSSSAFNEIGFNLFNTITGNNITLPVSAMVASQTSSAVLAGGSCQSTDCCSLVTDCIQSFVLIESTTRDPTIGAAYPPNADILCPYPVCSWAYQYDDRSKTCVQINPPNNQTALTHTPYESLSDCAEDYSRSPRSYCLEPLQIAYRICKHDVGLQ